MRDFIDESLEKEGTPLNRDVFMAIQGFDAIETTFEEGKIIEKNSQGHTLTTEITEKGEILEIFVGEKTIRKTTIFNEDGSITEVLS